ncbi:MAG TPA: MarR family transcriptional regulator [Nocardioides sp.]|uniref:MarR family winged helix-turn-helix transcriptional regulator n=1 Tax=Nocardioides sp. TaxID=35761 RepID=UPI002F3FFE78
MEDPFTDAAVRLNSFAVHLLRAMHRVDVEAGLTPARLSALSVLHFGGPRTLGRLARDEEVTSATMSRLVDALCDLGLATRTTHEDNARMVTVSASEAGHALMADASARRTEVIAEALRGLPPGPQRAVVKAAPHLSDLETLIRRRIRERPSA